MKWGGQLDMTTHTIIVGIVFVLKNCSVKWKGKLHCYCIKQFFPYISLRQEEWLIYPLLAKRLKYFRFTQNYRKVIIALHHSLFYWNNGVSLRLKDCTRSNSWRPMGPRYLGSVWFPPYSTHEVTFFHEKPKHRIPWLTEVRNE